LRAQKTRELADQSAPALAQKTSAAASINVFEWVYGGAQWRLEPIREWTTGIPETIRIVSLRDAL